MANHMKAAHKSAQRIASGLDKKQRQQEIRKWVKNIKSALKGSK